MRQAPGPALPVGTAGLDEYFDVWLGEYLKPEMALKRLRQATVPGLELLSASYVSPKARSLQASHLHERYQLLLKSGLPAATLEQGLQQLLDAKTLTVKRPHKSGGRGKPDKSYDLVTMVEGFTVSDSSPCDGGEGAAVLLVELHLKATEQGSLRPAVLLRAAIDELGGDAGWRILSVARTQLFEDGC